MLALLLRWARNFAFYIQFPWNFISFIILVALFRLQNDREYLMKNKPTGKVQFVIVARNKNGKLGVREAVFF